MDRRHHGSVHQVAVGQREEVEAVVNDVELVGPLEDRRDVQALGDLRIDTRVVGPSSGDDAAEVCGCLRIPRGEQRDVVPASHEPFGEQRGEQLPGAVVPWRGTPRDGGEDCNP